MNSVAKGSFHRIPCLTPEESQEIANRVISLKDYFIHRDTYPDGAKVIDGDYKFFTLGTSTYLDYADAHGDNAQASKKVLLDNFSDMYSVVAGKLSEFLDEPVLAYPGLNLPGFHIFYADSKMPTGVEYGGSIHRDYPHVSAEFNVPFIRPLSFTMVLQAPTNGASMNYWTDETMNDQVYAAKFGELSEDLQRLAKDTAKECKYNVGELIVHDGQTLHQVANMVGTFDDDMRITLQGHCILVDEGYVCYF